MTCNILEALRRPAAESPSLRSSRVGFALNSMDRPDFTSQTLQGIATEDGFDVVWVDGSLTGEGIGLTRTAASSGIHFVEVHREVRGGPDRAIRFGLARLLGLGYDFCGLIENDVVLRPGWFSAMDAAKTSAEREGLSVGAITARNFRSRILEYREGYSINWCIGAGMVLLSRRAAEILLSQYPDLSSSRRVADYYSRRFGTDLKDIWELWRDLPDRVLGTDWDYSALLYDNHLSSIGTIPSYGIDLEFDVRVEMRTEYVE